MRIPKRPIAMFAIVVLGLAGSAAAQLGGGRGRDMSGGGGTGEPSGDSGSGKATIKRYLPPKDGQDDTLGTLSVQTDEGKSLRLDIRTKDNVRVQLGSHEVPPEDFEKFLVNGLAVDVAWNTDKLGTRKTQYVTSLAFETLQIEGRVTGVDEETSDIKVFAKPAADRKWPELKKPPKPRPPKSTGGSSGSSRPSKPPKTPKTPKEKPVQAKQLKVRFMDGVSNLSDSAKQSLTVGDLRDYKDQQISATIVFGKTLCLLVDATIEGEKPEEETSDAGGAQGR